MFSACKANIISACGKNVFYRIGQHPPEAASRRRRQGHGLRPKARPGGQPTACGRDPHGLRPDALPGGSNALRAKIVPRNQEPVPSLVRLVDRRQSCTAIKLVAGPALACAVLPLPMSPAAPAPDPAPADPAPALLLWPCRCSCSCFLIRAAQGSPSTAKRCLGQGRTWAAHFVG